MNLTDKQREDVEGIKKAMELLAFKATAGHQGADVVVFPTEKDAETFSKKSIAPKSMGYLKKYLGPAILKDKAAETANGA